MPPAARGRPLDRAPEDAAVARGEAEPPHRRRRDRHGGRERAAAADRLPQLPRLPAPRTTTSFRSPSRASSPRPKEAALELLATRVGVGITGHVAETGKPLLLADAAACDFSVRVEGTDDIEESIIAVPLNYGTRVIGAIVISKLGLDQFDEDDLRLLEVLAGPRRGRAREREPLRGAAPRGRERARAARVRARARRRRRARPRAAADRRGIRAHRRRSARLAVAPGGRHGRPRRPRRHRLRGRAPVVVGRRFAAVAVAPFTTRLGPYFVGPDEYAAFSDAPAGGSGPTRSRRCSSTDAGARSPSRCRPRSPSASAS